MRILVDLNVLLDVLQRREPHNEASARALSLVLRMDSAPLIPVHQVTTLYYLLDRYASQDVALDAIDWLLRSFDVAACDKQDLLNARSMALGDFEDVVTSILASASGCTGILTRNVADFAQSSVPAETPQDFLRRLPAGR